jgi:hypothetical protein
MGLGIKKKLYYFLSYFEELNFNAKKIFKYNITLINPIKSPNFFINFDALYNYYYNYTYTGHLEVSELLNHNFDFLGIGQHFFGREINWSVDINSGYEWPLVYYKKLLYGSLTGKNGSDVKIPWELSRFQHVSLLAKAYICTNDERYAEETVSQINHWISVNPWCYGVNWVCAMEVAIRACNWILAWQMFKDSSVWSPQFHKLFVQSIWQHGCFIQQNLEDHNGIRTNHYLSDVVGLFFIGTMFPEFQESKQWQDFGKSKIIQCMQEMVYPDGVSFENSTSYHRLVIELFIYSAFLARSNNIEFPDEFFNRLDLMLEFIRFCTRPDGKMPMIGDADDGRFFIFSDHNSWDRWDHRYLLALGDKLFGRTENCSDQSEQHECLFWVN